MSLFHRDSPRAHSHDFDTVNDSPTFLVLVAIVAIMVAVPLAIFF